MVCTLIFLWSFFLLTFIQVSDATIWAHKCPLGQLLLSYLFSEDGVREERQTLRHVIEITKLTAAALHAINLIIVDHCLDWEYSIVLRSIEDPSLQAAEE